MSRYPPERQLDPRAFTRLGNAPQGTSFTWVYCMNRGCLALTPVIERIDKVKGKCPQCASKDVRMEKGKK